MRKLSKLEESEVLLNDDQNEKMCAVMDDELEKLYIKGSQQGVEGLMKRIWMTDKEQQKSLIRISRRTVMCFLCVLFADQCRVE